MNFLSGSHLVVSLIGSHLQLGFLARGDFHSINAFTSGVILIDCCLLLATSGISNFSAYQLYTACHIALSLFIHLACI
jgi:hypothetical protein